MKNVSQLTLNDQGNVIELDITLSNSSTATPILNPVTTKKNGATKKHLC